MMRQEPREPDGRGELFGAGGGVAAAALVDPLTSARDAT
jgi:hypothetical protein